MVSTDKIWATRTPDVTPNGQRTPVVPRKCRGANSVKYIGITDVIKPISTININKTCFLFCLI